MIPCLSGLRSALPAYKTAALRAYWHGFMGGDEMIACIEQAASAFERSEFQVHLCACLLFCKSAE